jgi:hypothetical protein
MKILCNILLIIGIFVLEVNLLVDWYLPYMDYPHIEIIYLSAFICRSILYALIITWLNSLWDKYLIKTK